MPRQNGLWAMILIEIPIKTLRVCLANSFARWEDSLAHYDEVLHEKPLGSTSFVGRKRVVGDLPRLAGE